MLFRSEVGAGYPDVASINRSIFRAVKPGGFYIANDAVAKAGAGMKEVETTHRVEPSAEIAEITQAGFVLDGQSDILRNKTDDHTAAMNNPEARDKADRFLLRFKKPANASNSDHRPKTGLGALADNTLDRKSTRLNSSH